MKHGLLSASGEFEYLYDSESIKKWIESDSDGLDVSKLYKKVLVRLIMLLVDEVLTEIQKQCFTKRTYENKSISEIAEEMGIKETTVYKHIKLARNKLKKYCDIFCRAFDITNNKFDVVYLIGYKKRGAK